MTDVVWEDPPPMRGRGEPKWAVIVAELKTHPGKWAIVATYPPGHKSASSTYGHLKTRYGLEVTVRSDDDGTTHVYARWPEMT